MQLAPAASVAPQPWRLDGRKKEEAFVPVMLKAIPVSGAAPLLVKVAITYAETEPTFVVPEKVIVEGFTDAVPGDTPVPERATLCGEFVALSAIWTEAVNAPPVVGSNATSKVQLAPAARVDVQVWWLDGRKKDEALAPTMLKEIAVRVVDPVLLSVTML